VLESELDDRFAVGSGVEHVDQVAGLALRVLQLRQLPVDDLLRGLKRGWLRVEEALLELEEVAGDGLLENLARCAQRELLLL